MHSLVWKQPRTWFTNQTTALYVIRCANKYKSLTNLYGCSCKDIIKCISSFWTPVFDFRTGWWTFSLLSAGMMRLNLELRESCGQLWQLGPNGCLDNCVNLHLKLFVASGHWWLNMKHKLGLASHVHNKPVYLIVKHLW